MVLGGTRFCVPGTRISGDPSNKPAFVFVYCRGGLLQGTPLIIITNHLKCFCSFDKCIAKKSTTYLASEPKMPEAGWDQ